VRTVVAALLFVATATLGSAQNLVVSNARILDGTGNVIDRGAVVVRDGKIVSVTAGTAPAVPGARAIDARGMTVMPGFIDAHRHPIPGNAAEWLRKDAAAQMQAFLDAGFTTVLAAIAPDEGPELRRRLEQGAMKGPRLFVARLIPLARGGPPGGGRGDPARFDTSRPPLRPTAPAAGIPAEETVRAVEAAAKAGFDYLKTVITVTPGGPETATLRLIVNEGKKRNIPTITHAVSVIDTLAAVDAGTAVLVHTPHIGRLEEDAAAIQKIAKAGIPMTSTLAVSFPTSDETTRRCSGTGCRFPGTRSRARGKGR
jgi:imidazolonepropionase-like amidohydrolase